MATDEQIEKAMVDPTPQNTRAKMRGGSSSWQKHEAYPLRSLTGIISALATSSICGSECSDPLPGRKTKRSLQLKRRIERRSNFKSLRLSALAREARMPSDPPRTSALRSSFGGRSGEHEDFHRLRLPVLPGYLTGRNTMCSLSISPLRDAGCPEVRAFACASEWYRALPRNSAALLSSDPQQRGFAVSP